MYELINVFNVFIPQLLLYPNYNDPLNIEAAQLFTRSPTQYAIRVKDYVQKFAIENEVIIKEDKKQDEEELSITSELDD